MKKLFFIITCILLQVSAAYAASQLHVVAMDEFKTYHDTERLQAFVNTTLGETWKEDEVAEESTTEDKLLERAEHYKGEIPENS